MFLESYGLSVLQSFGLTIFSFYSLTILRKVLLPWAEKYYINLLCLILTVDLRIQFYKTFTTKI